MESGFEEGASKSKPTSFNRKEQLKAWKIKQWQSLAVDLAR
jgi:hypothetical protein